MEVRPLILGTRASTLALAQTSLVQNAFATLPAPPLVEVKTFRTTGDKRQDLSLTSLAPSGHGYQAKGGERFEPGIFTKELESALLQGKIDVAVHSLKDLPTVMPEGLGLIAVLPRGDVSDVVILKSEISTTLDTLPEGSILATSSVRRQRQLQLHRPDIQIDEIRGNVITRLAQLRSQPRWAGLVLARAGLERLGYGEQIRRGWIQGHIAGSEQMMDFAIETLSPDVMQPAAGQGAIGLQVRLDDTETSRYLSRINHTQTFAAVTAERALLSLLGGGCQMPLGVTTNVDTVNQVLGMKAIYFRSTTLQPVRAMARGPLSNGLDVAAEVARQLQAGGPL